MANFFISARQTDRHVLFGVLYNKWYINHNFQITKNYKQQKIYMAKKLLINYNLFIFCVFTFCRLPHSFFQSIQIYVLLLVFYFNISASHVFVLFLFVFFFGGGGGNYTALPCFCGFLLSKVITKR